MATPPSRGSGITVPPGRRGSHLGITAPGARSPRGGGGGFKGGDTPTEGRRLVVGREIRLSGEITSCERLIVEGNVEADLNDSRSLEISEHGVFKGNATVDLCEVAGLFQGDLTVTGTLTVKSTGRIEGRLQYREMEIERGGRIIGTLEEMGDEPASVETSGDKGGAGAPLDEDS